MMMNKRFAMEELIPILSDLVNKYTSYDSTSVSYDKARQLMKSILYCINELLNSKELALDDSNLSAEQAYALGLSLTKEKFDHTKKLFLSISESFHSYQNTCYFDTIIKGMPAFFDWYDVVFDAGNHILTLDYPLLQPLPDLEGVDLIHEYLKRIQLEQLFLNRFSADYLLTHFQYYHKKHSELIHNVCRLPLRYAIGCMIVEQSIDDYHLTSNDLKQIAFTIEKKTTNQLKNVLEEYLNNLISQEYHNNQSLFDYFSTEIKDFSFELTTCIEHNCLEQIFPLPSNKVLKKQEFIEGDLMDDEKLRTFIEELRDCRYLSDKILMIKETIKTLTDLKEILNECFYPDEYKEVFQLLSKEELTVIQQDIQNKIQNEDELYEWEKAINSE